MIGERIGHFLVQRELASGGMGVVYEALHESLGKRAAVKVLSAELCEDPKYLDYAERFFDEARAVTVIDHPGVVRIFDCGALPDGVVYIIMEYLEGESLGARLRRLSHEGGLVPREQARWIGGQIADALAAAHEKRIVHRDLKPANVILVPDGSVPQGERPKLVDFGIAQFLDTPERRTTVGAILGTPVYMAPEQCSGTGRLDDRVDVYALGIMLYEMFAGAPPFQGDMGTVMYQHLMETPRALRHAAPGLPPALCALVDAMLAKDPAARPAMREVARRLPEAAAGGALGTGAAPTVLARAAEAPTVVRPASAAPVPRVAWLTPRALLVALALLLLALGLGWGWLAQGR